MKGLDLSRAWFREAVFPELERTLPEALPRLAAGLAGEGSDCFGFDDAWSRDHDWGPRLCLWLPDGIEPRLAEAVAGFYDRLPPEYAGYAVPRSRTAVRTAGAFYRALIGRADAPRTAADWLAIPEPMLAAATNGEVFWDGDGGFSGVRAALLAYYPPDVRLRRLAEAAALAAQTGQYNHPRCLRRGETLAALNAKARFLESAAQLVFLLNGRYRPFYKWTYRAMRELPRLGGEAYRLMETLAGESGASAQEAIEALCAALIAELRRQALSDSASDFLMEHCGAMLRRISEPSLGAMPVSLVF